MIKGPQRRQKFLLLEKRVNIAILTITLLLIVFPKYGLLFNQELSARYILIAYAFLSFVALLVNSKNLIITSISATGVIVLFLKLTLDSQVQFAPSNHTDQLDLQLVQLDQLKGEIDDVNQFVRALDADIVFLQGLTPLWGEQLNVLNSLATDAQFIEFTRVDIYGLGILTKREIRSIDTLEFESIPAIRLNLLMNEFDEVRVLCFLLPPGLTRGFKEKQKHFVDKLIAVNGSSKATIMLGNFNLTPWSDNLQYLKYKTDTKCSRVNKSRLNLIQENPFDYYPTSHVLYNRKFQNTYFSELEFNSSPVGVTASYQIKQ